MEGKLQGREHLITSLKAFMIRCKNEQYPQTWIEEFKRILKSEHPSLALDAEEKKELSQWIGDCKTVKV